MDGDLFSAGFAWGADPVATAATDDATPIGSANAGVPSDSKGPVAGAATATATPPRRRASPEKVTESHLFGSAVASVATVAETEGQRLERLLSQKGVAIPATAIATAESAQTCGLQTDSLGGVALVATVADWRAGVERMRRVRPAPTPYHTKWRTLYQDAVSFLNLWADDAFRLGWDVLDVFGVNADPAQGRYDRLGLVILLAGRPIQCLDEACAYIGKDNVPTVYHRALRAPGAVPVWQWCEGCSQ